MLWCVVLVQITELLDLLSLGSSIPRQRRWHRKSQNRFVTAGETASYAGSSKIMAEANKAKEEAELEERKRLADSAAYSNPCHPYLIPRLSSNVRALRRWPVAGYYPSDARWRSDSVRATANPTISFLESSRSFPSAVLFSSLSFLHT
ncbi:hypothetical protein IWX49DRAFT_346260 [Phyllosticta citricarpa]